MNAVKYWIYYNIILGMWILESCYNGPLDVGA